MKGCRRGCPTGSWSPGPVASAKRGDPDRTANAPGKHTLGLRVEGGKEHDPGGIVGCRIGTWN